MLQQLQLGESFSKIKALCFNTSEHDPTDPLQYHAESFSDKTSYMPLSCGTCPCFSSDHVDGCRDSDQRLSRASTVASFCIFLKGLLGVSLLSHPRILGETGLILGTITHASIIVACAFACFLLLKARSMAAEEESQRDALSAEWCNIETKVSSPRPIEVAFGTKGRLLTYGDVVRQLMGRKAALIITCTILVLHVLFASGMISAMFRSLWAMLGSEDDFDIYVSIIFALLLFPLVAGLLQIPTLKDLFYISAAGLTIYLVGCVGSVIYTVTMAAIVKRGEPDGPTPPNDMWEWKVDGIPVFIASTLYTIEGINLALPTANNLDDKAMSVPVVCAAVVIYGLLTLGIAIIGYIGGMGGGPGTRYEESGCQRVSYCLDSAVVGTVYQLSMSLALLLTLPVILYPSTEILEIWAHERQEQNRKYKAASDQVENECKWYTGDELSSQIHHALVGEEEEPPIRVPPQDKNVDPRIPGIRKHRKLRLTLAVLICTLGVAEKAMSSFIEFIRGIGLSIVGFILPPILYIIAREQADNTVMKCNGKMMLGLASLLGFGFFNMVLVCVSSFTEHDYVE